MGKLAAPNYTEFHDPRLVAIYDTACPIDSYESFYTNFAQTIQAKTIIDIGCGTGLLTCALARRGHRMIGIEPSALMLTKAKMRPGGEAVRWLQGDAVQRLSGCQADMAIMSGHVAQFFLQDADWRALLKALHNTLRPGGYLVFESRNPNVMPFAAWPSEEKHARLDDPKAGPVEWWAKFLSQEGERVRYEIHYLLVRSGEEIISLNELIFRTQAELREALEANGFSVQTAYGDWDKAPFNERSVEMIFVAKADAAALRS